MSSFRSAWAGNPCGMPRAIWSGTISFGLVAIAPFVMRDREHLGCLRVREGVVTLEQMYFADEIRAPDEIGGRDVKVDKRELEMAAGLIESFSGHFDPERYRDRYRDALA